MMDALRTLHCEYDMLPAGEVILCAVSGGADSMCLLHLLYELASECGFVLQCAHFNHKLRGAESDRDEAFVRAWCEQQKIPFICGSADVAAVAAERGTGIEETARMLRYDFLERTAKELGAARIATAHTANDNAESMLLNLVRGTGLQGLTGIPPRRGIVVRPLLNMTRTQVESYCANHDVPYVEDSSNTDERYSRNFLRAQVIPLLEQMNPKAVEHFSDAARRLRGDNDWLTMQAEHVVEQAVQDGNEIRIDAARLAQLPDSVALRAIRILLGKNCAEPHLKSVLALCRGADPSARANLPGLTAYREYTDLVIAVPEESILPPEPALICGEGRTRFFDTEWSVFCCQCICPEEFGRNPDTFFLSRDKIKGELILRTRLTGDRIRLSGRPTKSLKKLMIEEKIPLNRRAYLPVLADDAGVLAVASLGADESRLAQPGEKALKITFQKE